MNDLDKFCCIILVGSSLLLAFLLGDILGVHRTEKAISNNEYQMVTTTNVVVTVERIK